MMQLPRPVLVPAALLAGACPLVANSLHEDSTGDGEQILREAAAGLPAAGRVSVALFLLGFVALVTTLAILAAAIAAHAPYLAGTAAIAGAAAVAVKLAEAQTGMALREAAAEPLDPATAAVLVGIDEAGFTVHGFLLSLALGAAAVGLHQCGGLPGWLTWWGMIMGGLGVLAAAAGIVWSPTYVPVPFLLLLVWLVALGLVAARRPFVGSALGSTLPASH